MKKQKRGNTMNTSDIYADNEDNTLYVVRLLLFGFIPLWKVKHTKNEWKKIALIKSSKNKIIEYQFQQYIK